MQINFKGMFLGENKTRVKPDWAVPKPDFSTRIFLYLFFEVMPVTSLHDLF
jgi:hypothetical protein